MIKRMLHANVVVRDLERSLRFYRDVLRVRVLSEIGGDAEDPALGTAMGFGVPATYRGYLLGLGKGREATMIDLLQWMRPAAQGEPYDSVSHVGIARIALEVDDVDKHYEDLRGQGVEFLSPPTDFHIPPVGDMRACCLKDPDGTILELIQLK